MLCAECQSFLSDYIDGDLSERVRRAVDQHLRACAGCDSLRIDLGRIVEASASLPLHTPSPRVWERIEREIASGSNVVAGPRSWWDRLEARHVDFSISGKHIAAAAAAVVIGVGTLWTINVTSPGALPQLEVNWGDFNAQNQQAAPLALAMRDNEIERFRATVDEMTRTVIGKQESWSPELRDAFAKSLVESDARIAEAERAYAASPASATRETLMMALTEKLKTLERFANAGSVSR